MEEEPIRLIMEFHRPIPILLNAKTLEYTEVALLFVAIYHLFRGLRGIKTSVHHQIVNTVQAGIPEDLQQL